MADLTVIEGTAKDNGDSVVSRWEKQRSVKLWHKDRRSLVNLINDAIRQQDRSTLARKVIETVEAVAIYYMNNDGTTTRKPSWEFKEEIADALCDLFRKEGVEVE